MSRMPPLGVMTYYVIYDSPTDFPGLSPEAGVPRFVLRRHFQDLRDNVGSVDLAAWAAPTLAALRTKLPAGLYRIGRHPGDEPQICEVWI